MLLRHPQKVSLLLGFYEVAHREALMDQQSQDGGL
jgi:hypothetical protein